MNGLKERIDLKAYHYIRQKRSESQDKRILHTFECFHDFNDWIDGTLPDLTFCIDFENSGSVDTCICEIQQN